MLCNRHDVGARDLGDGDLPIVGGVEIDVVGTHTGGDTQLRFAPTLSAQNV